MSYRYLLDISLILISTKILGLATKKVKMPEVVGALLAGLILGPAMLNVLHQTNFINLTSELGLIVLMFVAGLQTDIKELKNTGKAAFVIALFGVVVHLAFGFVVAYFFNANPVEGVNVFLQNVFIGFILTATSVSITVETLKEMGKLNTKAGNAILGAAIIDDIIGIVGLTLVSSMNAPSSQSIVVLGKIAAFFVLSFIIGIISFKVFDKWFKHYHEDKRRFVITAFVFCLLFAFSGEHFFGVADITGAFIAGLIISNTDKTKYITARFETLSYMILSPIFFASIGIKVELPSMNFGIIAFSLVMLVAAIASKMIGCGLGAKLFGYKNIDCFKIGAGMVSRGEIALIIANRGIAMGLISKLLFAPIVLAVIATTIVAPILLKIIFGMDSEPHLDVHMESDLSKQYTAVNNHH